MGITPGCFYQEGYPYSKYMHDKPGYLYLEGWGETIIDTASHQVILGVVAFAALGYEFDDGDELLDRLYSDDIGMIVDDWLDRGPKIAYISGAASKRVYHTLDKDHRMLKSMKFLLRYQGFKFVHLLGEG